MEEEIYPMLEVNKEAIDGAKNSRNSEDFRRFQTNCAATDLNKWTKGLKDKASRNT